jgi:transcriptional regulator with XRE-family HTH domain
MRMNYGEIQNGIVVMNVDEEIGIVAERLETAMRLRDMTAAQLARATGINKSTFSNILGGKRHSTTTASAVKIARVLRVSVDYLLGLVDDPVPRTMALGALVSRLLDVARTLPSSRQRDLLLLAETYAEHEDERLAYVLRDIKDMILDSAEQDTEREREAERLFKFLENATRYRREMDGGSFNDDLVVNRPGGVPE